MQKMIIKNNQNEFDLEVNRLLELGWTIVPSTFLHESGIVETFIVVVEKPFSLPKEQLNG